MRRFGTIYRVASSTAQQSKNNAGKRCVFVWVLVLWVIFVIVYKNPYILSVLHRHTYIHQPRVQKKIVIYNLSNEVLTKLHSSIFTCLRQTGFSKIELAYYIISQSPSTPQILLYQCCSAPGYDNI